MVNLYTLVLFWLCSDPTIEDSYRKFIKYDDRDVIIDGKLKTKVNGERKTKKEQLRWWARAKGRVEARWAKIDNFNFYSTWYSWSRRICCHERLLCIHSFYHISFFCAPLPIFTFYKIRTLEGFILTFALNDKKSFEKLNEYLDQIGRVKDRDTIEVPLLLVGYFFPWKLPKMVFQLTK